MWTRYTYVCSYCDALVEITSQFYPVIDPDCICNTAIKLTYLGEQDATVDEDVTQITAPHLDSAPINQ